MHEDWFPADEARVEVIRGFVGSVREQKVLEAGMKYGITLQRLDARLKVGLDLDERYVRESKVKCKVRGDVFALPFKDNSFDTALFTEVIEHIRDPHRVLMELGRTASRVIISTPNNSWARKIKHRLQGRSNLIAPDHVQEWSLGELKSMARDNGFKVTKVRGLGFFLTYRFYSLMDALGKLFPGLSATLLLEIKRA
jgi:SAM-dependent methyltransferase